MPEAGHVQHLSPETVDALASGKLAEEGVLVELLSRLGEHCAVCAEVLESYPPERVAERAGETYEESFKLAAWWAGAIIVAERDEAGKLLDELLAEPGLGRAISLVQWSPRFATAGLASVLVDQSAMALEEDPTTARELATLAVGVADSLGRGSLPYDSALVENFRFVTRVRLAEALAKTGELDQAERELERAEEHRLRGSGEWFYRVEATLAQARLGLRRGELKRVRQRLAELGVWGVVVLLLMPWYGWSALRVEAELARIEGDPSRAVDILRQVLPKMRGEVPRVEERSTRLELVAALCEAEDFDGAWQEMGRLRILMGAEATEGYLGRRSFWSARALEGLGRLDEAADEYEAAWRELQAAGDGPDAVRAAVRFLALRHRSGGSLDEAIERVPGLLSIRELPGWAATLVFGVLEYVWRGSSALGEFLEEAGDLVDLYILQGPEPKPGQARQ